MGNYRESIYVRLFNILLETANSKFAINKKLPWIQMESFDKLRSTYYQPRVVAI